MPKSARAAASQALEAMRGGFEPKPDGKATVSGPVRPNVSSRPAVKSAAANSRRSLKKLKR